MVASTSMVATTGSRHPLTETTTRLMEWAMGLCNTKPAVMNVSMLTVRSTK